MNIYTAIILFLLGLNANAQISDDFNDGDFTNSPSWTGSVSDFNVNGAGQLQLGALIAGNSYLSVPVNPNSLDNFEWHFFIHLDFAPSSSNNCKVYLSSDQPDLIQPLNGYYLQFGEALSNDAVELFRQDGTTKTQICRAQNGMIANSFSAGIKVVRDSVGKWKLFADYSGGTNYNFEAEGLDTNYHTCNWLGMRCTYTSGNVDGFYFDEVYAGPELHDTIPPRVETITVVSDTILSILFSESIDSITLNDMNNYSVDNGINHPNWIEKDSTSTPRYLLHFSSSFADGVNYTLTISGLSDLNGNQMNDQQFSFTYSPAIHAATDDIVFSEIYFETSSVSPLPDAEYIEIYNRRDSAIILSEWKVSDGGSDGMISSFTIGAHDFAVLHSDRDSIEFSSIPNAIAVHSFPTLNNDVGDQLTLLSEDGSIISQLKYDNSFYHDSRKDDGGWSIERIDPDFICEDEGNWKASVSSLHGTPGSINSVNDVYADDSSPFLINAYLTDSFTIKIIFNEAITHGGESTSSYIITDEHGIIYSPVEIADANNDTTELKFANAFSGGIYSVNVASSLTDCAGNGCRQDHAIKFGFAQSADIHDVLINEILFYCKEGGNDFVEIYNRSGKIIDLKEWIITETDYLDSTDIKEQSQLTGDHLLFFPGQYLVLCKDESKVKNFYSCRNPYAFKNISSMPDFNSDNGCVIISDNNGLTIDKFCYSDTMHFPLHTDTRGISLERLNTENFNSNNQWHSAAATAGFATPGYENSERSISNSGGGELVVESEVFSPDGDGYNDVLTLHYSFPQTGLMLSLNVFDYYGQPVRSILPSSTCGSEGTIIWDGLTDNRQIASAGIYILLAKTFDLEGNNKVYKRTCFLTRNY